jgi:hypothetical protein
MGPRHSAVRRDATGADTEAPNAVGALFEQYLQEITPAFLREARDRRTPARPRERDGQPATEAREAMSFFSESRMR